MFCTADPADLSESRARSHDPVSFPDRRFRFPARRGKFDNRAYLYAIFEFDCCLERFFVYLERVFDDFRSSVKSSSKTRTRILLAANVSLDAGTPLLPATCVSRRVTGGEKRTEWNKQHVIRIALSPLWFWLSAVRCTSWVFLKFILSVYRLFGTRVSYEVV